MARRNYPKYPGDSPRAKKKAALPDTATVYDRWLGKHLATHAHCPLRCEGMVPYLHPGWGMICGRCWSYNETVSELIPCDGILCEGKP